MLLKILRLSEIESAKFRILRVGTNKIFLTPLKTQPWRLFASKLWITIGVMFSVIPAHKKTRTGNFSKDVILVNPF